MPFTKQAPFTKKVTDLPDRPSPDYPATDIKSHFQTPDDETRNHLNSLIDGLNANTGAINIGAKDEGGKSTTIQAQLDNKATNSRIKAAEDRITTAESDIESLQTDVGDLDSEVNNQGKRIVNIVAGAGESNTEIVDARYDSISEKTYPTLSDRLGDTTSQLAENENFREQEDFVQTLKRHMKYKGVLNITPSDIVNGIMSIVYDIGNGKAVSYTTYKDVNDDYVVISGGKYGNLTNSTANTGDKNYDSNTGSWNTASMPSYYATAVGATMTFSFYGSGLDFNFFGDNRGGLWRFIIDGDNANPVDISTWRSVATSPATVQVFRQTENKDHVVVATFQGDDPNNPPSTGVGTSRGWANYATDAPTHKPTFTIYAQAVTNTEIVELLASGSNKDFAISMRKSGTTNPYYFVPQHQAGTGFKVADIEYIVDGTPTTLQNGISLTGVRELKIIQQIYGVCPETPTDNLAKFTTIWSFYGDGTVNIDGKMEVLEAIDIDWGYGLMLTLNGNFAQKLVSSIGNKYDTLLQDGSNQYLTEEKDLANSYISLNNTTYKNLGVAITYNNPKQTLRQGKTNKPPINQNTFIQHRAPNNGVSIQKLYQVAYNNTTLQPGEIFRFSGTFFIASVDNLYDLVG